MNAVSSHVSLSYLHLDLPTLVSAPDLDTLPLLQATQVFKPMPVATGVTLRSFIQSTFLPYAA